MIFETSECSTEKKLANFTKYVRRQNLARFLVQIELFKMQLDVKGSIVECGVHHGGGIMAWAKLSATLEPYNYHRQIIGFDTFSGFPSVQVVDKTDYIDAATGMFAEEYSIKDELKSCIEEHDANRFLGEIPKVQLISGDANITIPEYIKKNPHLLISLLYLDFDIYEPTVTAIHEFLPRMPRGSVVVFDEINNPHWPGETRALLEQFDLRKCKIKCFEFEPNISYMVID